ncbi:MAG: hypothetical protein AAF993_16730, partial [Pseudomonadota bacterium]
MSILSRHLRSLLLVALGSAMSAHGLEADVRLKWFSTASLLPSHDIRRAATPVYDHSADMRLMFRHKVADVQLLVDHTSVWLGGDSIALNAGPDAALDQTVVDDSRRWMDLTWNIETGNRHNALHRLDRLA